MNCLYTLNIKNKQGWDTEFISDRVRRSFISACFRWGCNYAEVNHDPGHEGDAICNWGKLQGPKVLSGYDKLLYLDGDMIINDHAPNPFDLCVKEGIYAVTDAQNMNPNEMWMGYIYNMRVDEMLAAHPGWRQPPVPEYINTGFMMFQNTDAVRGCFEAINGSRQFEATTCYDQTVINIFVYNMLKVHLLPTDWNYTVWDRPPSEEVFINHFLHAGPSLQ